MKKYQETINLRKCEEIPRRRNARTPLVTRGILSGALAIILVVILTGCWVFFHRDGNEAEWYAVKLVNEEIYYGQIADLSADPVALNDVYYNYDQNETGNIRLVKRGNETHSPAGMMNIPRAQVVYMEQLSDDSKVLAAIRENEAW